MIALKDGIDMPPAPLPIDEAARLDTLRAHFEQTGAPDDALQNVAEAAAEILGFPIALISVVDSDRQFFQGCVGLDGVSETPRDHAFCAYTILGDELLEVPDARLDDRFFDNPLVTGDPFIRFYAGAPLKTDDGYRIGTLCIIDTAPRSLTEEQRAQLLTLVRTAARILAKIREQRRTQRELECALASAREAEATKAAFLASMSHELRTPLNAIIGFAQVLEGQLFGAMPDARYVDYASDIRASGEHFLELINDILDLSCIEAGKRKLYPEELDIAGELDWVRRMIAPICEKHRTLISVSCTDDISHMVWDRRALRQVLVNLASNAAKYGGRSCELAVRRGDAQATAVITVSDDGPGMAADVRDRVVRPFVRGETGPDVKQEGTGLGLSLCRGLVELGAGTISIESEDGTGTTVEVVLPGTLTEKADALAPD